MPSGLPSYNGAASYSRHVTPLCRDSEHCFTRVLVVYVCKLHLLGVRVVGGLKITVKGFGAVRLLAGSFACRQALAVISESLAPTPHYSCKPCQECVVCGGKIPPL